RHPQLVHNITNYVTVNDCANILLAMGASPIMADDLEEAEEITALCDGLVINIGTLNKRTIPAMLAAGKRANALKHPVVLDPVGAGASTLRTETALRLIDEVRFAAIRGNISEIKTLVQGTGHTQGVDADAADAVSADRLEEAVALAQTLSKGTGAVVVITGAVDIAADGSRAYTIDNGHPEMSKITGSGCMLSAMTGAYVAANPERPLEACACAAAAMGIAGELAAQEVARAQLGTGSLRVGIMDRISTMTAEKIEALARIKVWEAKGE
ncbi:MAG: hydroxyethylthiazole kinase, partial [Eubacterium sp.]|nr:hydroxyethylthiazole kinase [Eubacterium sp.]